MGRVLGPRGTTLTLGPVEGSLGVPDQEGYQRKEIVQKQNPTTVGVEGPSWRTVLETRNSATTRRFWNGAWHQT